MAFCLRDLPDLDVLRLAASQVKDHRWIPVIHEAASA
jgi:hypothetical protein